MCPDIPPEQLADWLPENRDSAYQISYQSGLIAMKLTVREVISLARRNMVYGVTKKGSLRSVRLSVSIRAAKRHLADCEAGSRAPAGAISIKKHGSGDARWSIRYDRAKSGAMGGSTGIAFTPMSAIMEALPGTKNIIERRVVA